MARCVGEPPNPTSGHFIARRAPSPRLLTLGYSWFFHSQGVFLALTRPRDQVSTRIGEFAGGNPWDLPCKLSLAPAAKDEAGFPRLLLRVNLGLPPAFPIPRND